MNIPARLDLDSLSVHEIICLFSVGKLVFWSNLEPNHTAGLFQWVLAAEARKQAQTNGLASHGVKIKEG